MASGAYVSASDPMPQGEHWAIIEVCSVTIPGDERSRQAPGHGYPERTEEYVSYQVFHDEPSFRKELKDRFRSQYTRERVRGIHVTEMFAPVVQIEVQKS